MAQTIGTNMPHGYAGSYARQPDAVTNTYPLQSGTLTFGAAAALKNGALTAFGVGCTAENFIGIAAREIKTATTYRDQSAGEYLQGEAVSVMTRGCVSVGCNIGSPVTGGKVYIRVLANAAKPTGVIGGLEAEVDGSNVLLLPNCRWQTGIDANKIAEMHILTCNV